MRVCFNYYDVQANWKYIEKTEESVPRATLNGILCNTTMWICVKDISQKCYIVPYILQSSNKLRYIVYLSIVLITHKLIVRGTIRKTQESKPVSAVNDFQFNDSTHVAVK